MITANQKIAVAFPPENVSPEKKSKPDWGLQAAKAIWYANDAYGPNMFYKARDTYRELIEFAFGQQDENRVKPAVGITPENQTQSFVGGISWKTKKFAIKRVMSTVSKIFNRKYDPVATAIDPVSSDRRESFKASLKTWMDHQAWLMERQQMVGADLAPEGVDMSALPMNDEDLQIYMQNDFKLNQEILLELGITHHIRRNDWDSVKEIVDWYLTVLPVAAVWTGLDSGYMPVIKVLNPYKILCPTSEFKDFKRIGYCAYLDSYTVSEFKKMVGGEIPPHELDLIIQQHSQKGNYKGRYYSQIFPETDNDVDKIYVMHFEIKQTNEYTYLQRKDKFGNDRFVSKPYEYYRGMGVNPQTGQPNPGPEDFRKRYRNERQIHRVPQETVYAGYWVVGTEVLFGYGEKNYCNGELGYKLRASNMVDGMATSMVEQMVPCIEAIERYDKKIQSLCASALHQAVSVDFSVLRKVAFKSGGKDLTSSDLFRMFLQTGIIPIDTSDWGAGDNTKKPINVEKLGISDDIVKYMELLKFELEQLDEIIGYNKVTTASTLSPETGARVAQQMDVATDTALDHLYRADRGLCLDVYRALGHLHKASVQMNPDYYVSIFGEEAVSRILMSSSYDQHGIDIEARITQQEWNLFYEEINADERLRPEDRAALRRFQSLKEAYAYLRVLTRRREMEVQQFELQKIRETTQQQTESAQLTGQIKMSEKQFERETELMLRQLEDKRKDKDHQQKLEQINLQLQLMNQGKIEEAEVEGDYKIAVAKSRPRATA